jgi:transcriptional regulator with XRE-family HTH domain
VLNEELAATDWLAGLHAPGGELAAGKPAAGEPTAAEATGEELSERTARYLLGRYEQGGTEVRLVCAVRGVHLALLRAGWWLQVDDQQLLGRAQRHPSASRRTPQLWARLWSWTDSARAACVALYAAGVSPEDAIRLCLRDAHPSGESVTTRGQVHQLEAGCAGFLRAARLERLADGARDDDVLLVDLQGSPMRVRNVGDAVTAARTDAGLLLVDGRVAARSTGGSWNRRLGVRVAQLATSLPPRQPPLTASRAGVGDTAAGGSRPPAGAGRPPRRDLPVLLDALLLRTRRLELGVSGRDLSRQIGCTPTLLTALENGTNHDELTLGLVLRLHRELGLDAPPALRLAEQQPERGEDGHDADPARELAAPAAAGRPDDAAALGAALGEVGVLMHRDLTARALGWDLDRLAAAAGTLGDRLPGTGLRLHLQNSQLGVLRDPGALPAAQLRQVLDARASNTHGLTRARVELLCQVARGKFTEQDSNPARVDLAWALKRDLVERDGPNSWKLSDRAARSLMK